MANLVIVTSEMAGRINISCELARRLTDAGHSVHLAGRHPAVGAAAAGRGIPYLDVSPRLAESHSTQAPPDRGGRLRGLITRLAVENRRARTARRARTLGVEEFTRALAHTSPELVLVDVELTELLMAASASGHTTAGWTSMQSPWKRPGLPPLGSSIMPGSGPAGSRLAIELAWLRLRIGRRLQHLRQFITRVGEDRISVLRWSARQLGLRFDDEFDLSQWLVPAVPRRTPVLSFTPAELEFPHRPAPGLTYVGPVIGRRLEDDEASRRVGEIVARVRSTPGRALIYCSFGAWDKGDDGDVMHRIVKAVASQPDWELIVGLGHRLDPAGLDATPDNVHVFGWAPQTEVLQHADAAIHHAGISSVNECLHFGVPMVVYPFDYLDQPGNAARIEYHGLGVRGDRIDSPATIAQHLARAVGGEFDASLRAMRRNVLAYEDSALTAIEQLIGEPATHQDPSSA